jgi:hypothetical protein
MVDAIRRIFHLVFGTPQPIEWWLLGADLAIVFLIIWLDVPEYFHKRRVRKIMLRFQPLIEIGEKLQREVPRPVYGQFSPETPGFVEQLEKETTWM